MSEDRDSEPFLSRWSRQKQQQAQTPAAKRQPLAPTAGAEAPEPEIDLSKLTRIEDLTAGSDITQFLRKGVPEALQRLALRKMWSLDPAIRDFIEVAENQWDFNVPGGIPGLFQDVAEGTDVSVWMAQATQSAFGDDAKRPAEVAATEADGDAPTATARSAPEAVQPGQPPEAAPGDEADPVVAAASAARPDVPAAPPAGPAGVRRRHGGALPV